MQCENVHGESGHFVKPILRIEDRHVMDISLYKLKLDSYIGSKQGHQAFSAITDQVDTVKDTGVFNISFSGIEQIDACFVIAGIIALSRVYKGAKHFYLSGIQHRDILTNLKCVATVYEMPLLVLDEDKNIEWIGKSLTPSNTELLNYIYSKPSVTTAVIAKKFNLSVPNASIKLKKLYDQGYVMAKKQDAVSGGHEFIYTPILATNLKG